MIAESAANAILNAIAMGIMYFNKIVHINSLKALACIKYCMTSVFASTFDSIYKPAIKNLKNKNELNSEENLTFSIDFNEAIDHICDFMS